MDPLSPAWVRALVAVVWVLWAVVASARPGTPDGTPANDRTPAPAAPAPTPAHHAARPTSGDER